MFLVIINLQKKLSQIIIALNQVVMGIYIPYFGMFLQKAAHMLSSI